MQNNLLTGDFLPKIEQWKSWYYKQNRGRMWSSQRIQKNVLFVISLFLEVIQTKSKKEALQQSYKASFFNECDFRTEQRIYPCHEIPLDDVAIFWWNGTSWSQYEW